MARKSLVLYDWESRDKSYIRATWHTRLSARDHYTSSTLIGGKGGAGPSSLHITLEGPTEYVNAYMDSYMASNGSCFMVTWTIFQKPPLGGRPNTKPGDHGTPNVHNRWHILFYHVWEPTWINDYWNSICHIWLHVTLEDPWPHYMIWEVCWDNLWTLFFWELTISWSRLLAHVLRGN
jgi:hypothetical protein